MARKIKAKTQNDGWKEPTKKVRKKRKPMSEKQRQEAAARLAVAREKKKIENPTFGMSGIHPSLHNLKDDHPISVKKVKEWIRSNREMMSSYRTQMRKDVKGARARYYDLEGYIRFMKHYLKHGDWVSDVYGEHQEKRTKWRVVASPIILS